MKKLITKILLIFNAIISLTSCSNNEDEPMMQISMEQLIGFWDATAVQFNNDGIWIDISNTPDLALHIRFYENGSYYGHGALGNGSGIYMVTDNTIKTFVDGELYVTYIVNSLTEDKAELQLIMGNSSMLVRAKKSKLNLSQNDLSIIAYNGDPNGNKVWRNDLINGNHLIRTQIQFTGITFFYETLDCTISEKGINIFYINGQETKVEINNQSTIDGLFSFDGKTLVMRNDETGEEKILSALVEKDVLIISDDKTSMTFYKSHPLK